MSPKYVGCPVLADLYQVSALVWLCLLGFSCASCLQELCYSVQCTPIVAWVYTVHGQCDLCSSTLQGVLLVPVRGLLLDGILLFLLLALWHDGIAFHDY